MQVLGSMLGDSTKLMIKNTISTKINTLAKWNNSHSLYSNTAAHTANAAGLSKTAIGNMAATATTKSLTLAQRGLQIAMGPIGLIFIGISAAMAAYETNALGLKDTINGLLGIQDEMNDTMGDGRGEADEFAKSLENMDKVGQKMPTTFAKMRDAVLDYKASISKTVAEAEVLHNQHQTLITQANSIKANSLLSDFRVLGLATQNEEEATGKKISAFKGLPQFLTGFLATEASKGTFKGTELEGKFILNPNSGKLMGTTSGFDLMNFDRETVARNNRVANAQIVITVLEREGIDPSILAILPQDKRELFIEEVARMGTLQEILASPKLQEDTFHMLNEQLAAENKPLLNRLTLPFGKNIFNRRFDSFGIGIDPNVSDTAGTSSIAFKFDQFSRLNFITPPEGVSKDRFLPSLISRLLASGNEHLVRELDPLKQRNFILNGIALNPLLGSLVKQARATSAGANVNAFKLSGINEDFSNFSLNRMFRLLTFRLQEDNPAKQIFSKMLGIQSFDVNGTPNIRIPNDVKSKIQKIVDSGSAIRAEVFVATGIDVGRVADSLPREDVFRIAGLEQALQLGMLMSSPEQLAAEGFLIKNNNTIMVGPNGELVESDGRTMTFDLVGKKYTLPIHDKKTMDAMNSVREEQSKKMANLLGINADLVIQGLEKKTLTSFTGNTFSKSKLETFGSKFFGIGGVNTGKAGFEGVSATLAFQSVGRPKVHPEFRRRRLARDRLANSGLLHLDAAKRFAFGGAAAPFRGGAGIASRSAADSIHFKKASMLIQQKKAFDRTILAGFGNFGMLSEPEIQSLFDAGLDDIAKTALDIRDDFHRGGLGFRAQQDALNQTVAKVLQKVGLDTRFTQKLKSKVITVGWRRKKRVWYTVGESPMQILRQDLEIAKFEEEARNFLGNNVRIRIPSINRKLMKDAIVFYQNKFTDFNDMSIASQALNSLVGQDSQSGITAQQIWDIRFNTTRGDRELENRMRFERMEAMATGVSDL
ncbi:MAG: hypothetical protein ACE5Q4_04390 [Nitrosopumilus sp.]